MGFKTGVCVYVYARVHVCVLEGVRETQRRKRQSFLSVLSHSPRLCLCSSPCLNSLSTCPFVADAVGPHLYPFGTAILGHAHCVLPQAPATFCLGDFCIGRQGKPEVQEG